jgi:Phosphate-starvation-inducible E family
MSPEAYKRIFSGILDTFERVAYLAIALALSVPIVMLVVSAVTNMLEVSEVGVLETSLTVLDRMLLAFIFVELIDTVRVTVRERGIFWNYPEVADNFSLRHRNLLHCSLLVVGGTQVAQ